VEVKFFLFIRPPIFSTRGVIHPQAGLNYVVTAEQMMWWVYFVWLYFHSMVLVFSLGLPKQMAVRDSMSMNFRRSRMSQMLAEHVLQFSELCVLLFRVKKKEGVGGKQVSAR
jgi:hypothetical protein